MLGFTLLLVSISSVVFAKNSVLSRAMRNELLNKTDPEDNSGSEGNQLHEGVSREKSGKSIKEEGFSDIHARSAEEEEDKSVDEAATN